MSHEEVSAASPEERTHLWHIRLLANSIYDHETKNLPGVADDARGLEACEFFRSAPSYERWDDLTFEEIRQRFHDWCERWEDNHQMMFVFLGHGTSSPEKRTRCLESTDGLLIDLDNLWDHVHAVKTINFSAFFACCQHAGRDPALVKPLFPAKAPVEGVFGSQAFCHFACRPGQGMYDTPVGRSKYLTEYVACLKQILCNGELVSQIPIYLQEKVSQKTLRQQHPDYRNSFVNDCRIWDDGAPIPSLTSFSASGLEQDEVSSVRLVPLSTGASSSSSSLAVSHELPSREVAQQEDAINGNNSPSGSLLQSSLSEAEDELRAATPRIPKVSRPCRGDTKRKKWLCPLFCGLYVAFAACLSSFDSPRPVNANADCKLGARNKAPLHFVETASGISMGMFLLSQLPAASSGSHHRRWSRDLVHQTIKASTSAGCILGCQKLLQRLTQQIQEVRESQQADDFDVRLRNHMVRYLRSLPQEDSKITLGDVLLENEQEWLLEQQRNFRQRHLQNLKALRGTITAGGMALGLTVGGLNFATAAAAGFFLHWSYVLFFLSQGQESESIDNLCLPCGSRKNCCGCP